MKKLRKNITAYDYLDYKRFLQDIYADYNSQDAAFSHRYLQKKAGYSDKSNHFWQIATGYAKLSPRAAQRYAQALGLGNRETRYFLHLVELDQASNDEQRQMIMEQLRRLGGKRAMHNAELIRHEFYSQWYLPVLRELVSVEDFKEDPSWIASRLRPHITPRQARSGLNRLIELGFLSRNPQGKLQPRDPFIGEFADREDSTKAARLSVRNFHREMIRLGSEAIEAYPQQRRFISGITMAISRRQAEALKELLAQQLNDVKELIVEPEPIEVAYRLNVQLFPLLDDATEEPKTK